MNGRTINRRRINRRFLTLLVVPHDEGNVRRFHVSYGRLKLLAVGLGVLAVVAGVGIVAYGRISARALQAEMLERENARLEAKTVTVDQIVANLERSEKAYQQIRLLAGLGPAEAAPVRPAAATSEGAPIGRTLRARTVPEGWPLTVRGFMTAAFSGADDHSGVDLAAPTNTPVLATANGRVKQTGYDRVFGHFVVLAHEGGFETMFAHNAHVLVDRGDEVDRGETIAYSGNSGRSTAPHLHYEVRRGGLPVDPAPYLR